MESSTDYFNRNANEFISLYKQIKQKEKEEKIIDPVFLNFFIAERKTESALTKLKMVLGTEENVAKSIFLFYKTLDPALKDYEKKNLKEKIKLSSEEIEKSRFFIAQFILSQIDEDLKEENNILDEETTELLKKFYLTCSFHLDTTYFNKCFLLFLKIANQLNLLDNFLKIDLSTEWGMSSKLTLIENQIHQDELSIINGLKEINLKTAVENFKQPSILKALLKSDSIRLIDCVLGSIEEEERKIIYRDFIDSFSLEDGEQQINENSIKYLFFDLGSLFETVEDKIRLFFGDLEGEEKLPFLTLIDYCGIEKQEIEKSLYSIFLNREQNKILLNSFIESRKDNKNVDYADFLKNNTCILLKNMVDYIMQQWPSLNVEEVLQVLNPHKKENSVKLQMLSFLLSYIKKNSEEIKELHFSLDEKEKDLTLLKMHLNTKSINQDIINSNFFNENLEKIATFRSVASVLSEIGKNEQWGVKIWQKATPQQREHLWSILPSEEGCKIYKELSSEGPLTNWPANRKRLQDLLNRLEQNPSAFKAPSVEADQEIEEKMNEESDSEIESDQDDEEIENDGKEEEDLNTKRQKLFSLFFKMLSEQDLVDLAAQLPADDGILINSLRYVTKKRLFAAIVPHFKPATLCLCLKEFSFNEKCKILPHITAEQKQALFAPDTFSIYPKCFIDWRSNQIPPEHITEAKFYLQNKVLLKKAIGDETMSSSVIENIEDFVKEFEKQKDSNAEEDSSTSDFFGKPLNNPITLPSREKIDLESWHALLLNSEKVKDPFTNLPLSATQLSNIEKQIEQLESKKRIYETSSSSYRQGGASFEEESSLKRRR